MYGTSTIGSRSAYAAPLSTYGGGSVYTGSIPSTIGGSMYNGAVSTLATQPLRYASQPVYTAPVTTYAAVGYAETGSVKIVGREEVEGRVKEIKKAVKKAEDKYEEEKKKHGKDACLAHIKKCEKKLEEHVAHHEKELKKTIAEHEKEIKKAKDAYEEQEVAFPKYEEAAKKHIDDLKGQQKAMQKKLSDKEEKVDVPQIQIIEKIIEVPGAVEIVPVPQVQWEEVVRYVNVPRASKNKDAEKGSKNKDAVEVAEKKVVEKKVEVPEVEYIEMKIVPVPQIQYEEVIKYVNVPKKEEVIVPQIQVVEKIVEVEVDMPELPTYTQAGIQTVQPMMTTAWPVQAVQPLLSAPRVASTVVGGYSAFGATPVAAGYGGLGGGVVRSGLAGTSTFASTVL